MSDQSPYYKHHKITDKKFGACDIYYMKPGNHEPKHYHDCVEIVYVVSGSSSTHNEGMTYTYKPGEVHETINDSNEELVLACMTIPPESDKNTTFV